MRTLLSGFHSPGIPPKTVFSLALALAVSVPLAAATYYSKASANISVTSTWTADTLTNTNAPSLTASDILIIRNGHTINLNAAFSAGQVIIRSGGVLTANGSRTLTTSSPLTILAGGRLNLDTRTITLVGDCINQGTINGTTGQLTMNTYHLTNNNEITLTTGRLNFTSGSFTNNGTVTLTGGRMVIDAGLLVNTGTILLGNGSYLTQSTGSITNTATGTITVQVTSSTATITLGSGNLINENTAESIDFASAAIAVNGTGNQQIGSFITRGRFNFSKTGGTATLTGNITMAGISVNGSGGTLNLGTGLTHDITAAVSLSAGTLRGGSSTLLISLNGSPWTGTGSLFFPDTSTVVFNGNGAQQITATAPRTFYNLSFTNAGIKSKNSAALTVTNIFSVEDDAAISTTANQVPTLGTNATLQYRNSTSRVPGLEWPSPFTATGGVVIDSATVAPAAAKVFNQGVPLTILPGGTLTTGSNQFTFNGDFINQGTWSPSSGNIVIGGTANQLIGSFETTGTVTVSKTAGTASLQGNMLTGNLTMNGNGGVLDLGSGTHTIANTWTNTAGTVQGNSAILNVNGTVTGSGGIFEAGSGLVHFRSASSQTIPAFTYNQLEITADKSLSDSTAVLGTVTIHPGATFSLDNHTLELSGTGTPLVNNGIFEPGNGTVRYSAAGSALIAAVAYYDLDGSGGDRVLDPAGTIGIAGSFTPGTGNYTVANSTVVFNGSAEQVLPAFRFHHLELVGSNKRITANTIVDCYSVKVSDGGSLEINGTGGGRLNITH